MRNLSASFMFSGYSDYWSGASGRGERGGAAFAFYGKDTTLRDLVDQWVEDTWTNDCDFEGLPESVSSDDIREAILDSFTEAGRADYNSGKICEFSREWADINDVDKCRECGELLGEPHDEDCSLIEDDENIVVEEDLEDDDDYGESPIAIMWIEWDDGECPAGCGREEDLDNVNGLCDSCLEERS